MLLRLIFYSFLCLMMGCSDPRSETDIISDRILCQLAKKMEQRGLYAIGSGGGCTIEGKINLISIVFQYPKVMTLPEARELIVESIQTLLDLMNADPENAHYFEVFPAPVNIISISILAVRAPTDLNSVETVRIVKGEVSYDIKHPLLIPGQPNLTLKEESFEEAQKIVESQMMSENT